MPAWLASTGSDSVDRPFSIAYEQSSGDALVVYATGNTTASVMGRTYPGAGASLGPSFTWGYVGAKHAASGAAGQIERELKAAAAPI